MGDIEGSAAFGEPVDAIVSALDAGRARAMASVARERFATYHAIGSAILARQQAQGWGSQVIKRLAADLRMRFPDQTGLGVRNLHYMRKVALAWPDPNCAAAAAQLPWGHEIVLLDRLPDTSQRDWYAAQAYAGGWSRGALEDRIRAACGNASVPRRPTSPTDYRHRTAISPSGPPAIPSCWTSSVSRRRPENGWSRTR
ncbi:DUF1016 N-terminal domain-containing protein [Enemella evansiae]|uniref:DUF1016 N-terminal domain-containing protein n=1 Tax=Enemella evansiae TaxID=2016499 RepID=UPI0015C6366C|nr:DUF1016 N-terminal domain-containing protein [Enemella evansiae]